MNTETTEVKTPKYTQEQRKAWLSAKQLLKEKVLGHQDARPLHIAMSLLRGAAWEEIETPSKHEGKRRERQSLDAQSCLRERVQEWLDYFQDPGRNKLFVFVDKGLTPSQRAVQAAHCAAAFQEQHPHAPWTNGTMVLLATSRHPYRPELLQTPYLGQGFRTEWTEPDMDGRVTAVAMIREFKNDELSRGYSLL